MRQGSGKDICMLSGSGEGMKEWEGSSESGREQRREGERRDIYMISGSGEGMKEWEKEDKQ